MGRRRNTLRLALATALGLGAALVPARADELAAPAATRSTSDSDLASLSLEDLMNVEVTSVSKHKQKIAEAPAAVTVISQEDIERSGLQSIPELLRLVPGTDVARIDASQWAISSRGFNDLFGNKLLVLMDGRTVYTPLFSGVFWDMQDYVLQDLDRIEVIRGPGATLWGSNAVNGVINIESKSASDTQGWLIDGLGGNELNDVSVRYGGKLDEETCFRVFTKYRSYDEFPLPGGAGAHDGWQSLLTGLRVDHYASDRDTLTFEASGYGSYNADMVRVPDLAATVPVGGFLAQIQDKSFDAAETYALGRWSHTISETSDLALQIYYDYLTSVVWQGGRYELHTADIDFQHRFALDSRQEITWGLGYRFTADHAPYKQALPGVASFVTPSRRDDYFANGFIQDDIAIVPERIHFIVGTKLEENSYSDFEVEPSAKMLWTPNDRQTLWGSISRAVVTPSRWEQDATLAGFGVPTGTGLPGLTVNEPNPAFQSEELVAYEAGYRLKPAQSLSLDFSGFFNHYDRLQGFEFGTPFPSFAPPAHIAIPTMASNNLQGHSFGGEIAANWSVTESWRLSASYSYIDLKIHHSTTDPFGQTFFDNSATPHNQFQLHSYWDLLKNLQLNASAYTVEGLGVGVGAYVRVDLGFNWRIRDGLQLTAGVQNLLDNQHLEFRDFRVPTIAAEVPRTFYGELTWRP